MYMTRGTLFLYNKYSVIHSVGHLLRDAIIQNCANLKSFRETENQRSPTVVTSMNLFLCSAPCQEQMLVHRIASCLSTENNQSRLIKQPIQQASKLKNHKSDSWTGTWTMQTRPYWSKYKRLIPIPAGNIFKTLNKNCCWKLRRRFEVGNFTFRRLHVYMSQQPSHYVALSNFPAASTTNIHKHITVFMFHYNYRTIRRYS